MASRHPVLFRVLASAGLAMPCDACTGSSEPLSLGQSASAVVSGEPSPDTQNAVVLMNGLPRRLCTGSLVSATLVLTARHCMFDYVETQEERFCDAEGGARPIRGPHPLDQWLVQTGSAKPLNDAARIVSIYSNEVLDTCASDVALVELDRPLEIDPLPLRLDAPPQIGEWGTLVGWGLTSTDPEQEVLPDQRRQREIRIEAVSPGLYGPDGGTLRPLDPNSFAGTSGACEGDSGGPLISRETGAVIGVQYVTRPAILGDLGTLDYCATGTSTFQRLDLQRDWIRQAFWNVGAAPWLEGRARPGVSGNTCDTADECASGLCITAGSSSFCSVYCDERQCPDGFECITRDAGERVCIPGRIGSVESGSNAGCMFGRGGGSRWMLAGGLLAILRARRRRTTCERDPSSPT